MLMTACFEFLTEYLFTVTDDITGNIFEYRWGKIPPEGQYLTTYLQNCKREAELLAQHEIDKETAPQEIII